MVSKQYLFVMEIQFRAKCKHRPSKLMAKYNPIKKLNNMLPEFRVYDTGKEYFN